MTPRNTDRRKEGRERKRKEENITKSGGAERREDVSEDKKVDISYVC